MQVQVDHRNRKEGSWRKIRVHNKGCKRVLHSKKKMIKNNSFFGVAPYGQGGLIYLLNKQMKYSWYKLQRSKTLV